MYLVFVWILFLYVSEFLYLCVSGFLSFLCVFVYHSCLSLFVSVFLCTSCTPGESPGMISLSLALALALSLSLT